MSTASGGGGQFDISHPEMAKIKNKMKNERNRFNTKTNLQSVETHRTL